MLTRQHKTYTAYCKLALLILTLNLWATLVSGNSTIPGWNFPPHTVPKPVRLRGIENSRSYLDKFGRERLFRGTNVVQKGFPYYPNYEGPWNHHDTFCEEDAKFFADTNFNAIRLGIFWPGGEPVRGQYNQSYFEHMKNIVRLCEKYGIYVLLDLHQDSFSEKFCGEGIPDWAVDTSGSFEKMGIPLPNQVSGFPIPLSHTAFHQGSDGKPSKSDCGRFDWSTYHLSYASSNAYQNLYDNQNGLRDSFAAFWKKIAQEFKDFDNILAYELMNEPFAGAFYHNPYLLFPGVADRVNLQGFYHAVAREIRSVDQSTIIAFEGVTWDNFVYGFTEPPGGMEYGNLSAISYHYYAGGFGMGGGACIVTADYSVRTRVRDAIRLGCGTMITEFASNIKEPAFWMLDILDDYMQPWFVWEYKTYTDLTGTINQFYDGETGGFQQGHGGQRPLWWSRTFAQAVQGRVINHGMRHFKLNGTFVLKYKADPSIQAPTEIRICPQLWYSKGYTIKINPAGAADWSLPSNSTNIINVMLKSSVKYGELIVVTIDRKD